MRRLKPESGAFYEEPIIQFVDQLIQEAQHQGVSDIHIEPYEQSTRIRYRQDGLLYEVTQIENALASRVIARLKVLADLDLAEHRLPQDGRFKINHPRAIDLRLSSCPTLHGEKIVLRLLENNKLTLSLDTLGMTHTQKTLFTKKISEPQGLILVTGPTGSGKTITLYTALDYLNTREKNIVTVEDPVEIQIEGINQVPIHPKAGLDFALILRAFLRQDPDIIMVGEIRDRETAEIAIQAAQTGHLVLSTLHTGSATETLTRLLSMGIAPYQLVSALTLIVAQRLLRKLCKVCKEVETKKDCQSCREGYSGRMGIFECLAPSESLLKLALKTKDTSVLRKAAEAEGFKSLQEIGLEKIRQGETNIAELERVLLL